LFIMSRRADDLAEEVRTLPRREQLRLVERVVHDLADQNEEQQAPSSLIGCFADQADLMDEIAAGSMAARERDPLRRLGA
jgi:hypothetical protein